MQWTGKEMQSHLVGKMKASQVFSPHLSPADDVMMQLEREDGSKAWQWIWGGEGDAGEGGQLERRLLLDQEGKGRQMLTLPRWLLAGAPRWWRWRAGAGSAAGEVDVVVVLESQAQAWWTTCPPLTRWSRWCSRYPPTILQISEGSYRTPLSFFAQLSEQKKTSWAHKCPSVLFNSPVQTNIERGHFELSAEGIYNLL